MIKLWIYTQNHCEWQDVDALSSYQDFNFEQYKYGLCIFNSHSKKYLRGNESCVINDTLFYLEEKESILCHFPIQGNITVEEVLRVIFNCAQRVYHDIIL